METVDTVTVGIVLVLIFPLLFIEAPAYTRGGYTAEFWRLSLDDKLDHIAQQPDYFTRMGVAWLPILALTVAAMTAFSYQLASLDAGTLGYLALGAFLFGAFAWLVGVLVQTTSMRRAAAIRAATGVTPDWLEAAWSAAWWSELTFVAAANVAFIVWGVAILDTGFPADWMGWAAIGLGVAALLMVGFAREAFPQLGVIVPIILGVALLVS